MTGFINVEQRVRKVSQNGNIRNKPRNVRNVQDRENPRL